MGTEVTDDAELRTPLYDTHVRYEKRIVPFTGYLLPVQCDTGTITEHMAVCIRCGLFGVSHMGEIIYKGSDTQKSLNMILTNDYTVMADGQARYSPMCSEDDGAVDDLIVYKIRGSCYFIVVDAANKDKDLQWMKAHRFGDAESEDISDRVAQLALRGPRAVEILRRLAKEEDIPGKYYTYLFDRITRSIKCIIPKTDYTGEDGVEIYLAPEDAPAIWGILMETGQEEGLIPCGLGTRDTLRLEASVPLYGHEMDDTISPKEARLGIFVRMDKEDFIGKQALVDEGPLTGGRIGLKVTGRGIIREHQVVYAGGRQIRITTSGTHCPYLGYPVAVALVDVGYKEPGIVLEIEARGQRVTAEVMKLPFYEH